MPQLAIQAALIGGSSLLGALGNRKSARTSEQSSTARQSSSNTSSARRYLTPEQQSLQTPLSALVSRRINDPSAGLAPIKNQAINDVNRRYSALPDVLREKYATGPGKSGKYGRASTQAELARLGELGDVDANFAKLIYDAQTSGAQLGTNLLGMNFGSDVTSSGTFEGSQTGTAIAPGSPLAGGLGGGLEALFQLLSLDKYSQATNGGGLGGIFRSLSQPGLDLSV